MAVVCRPLIVTVLFQDDYFQGTWVAQLVEHLTIDFGSGHDLTVHEFKPCSGLCADNVELAWDSVFPAVSAPPPLLLCLKINK